MKEVKINVDGMMCGMCEAHVNDAIRKALPEATKIRSSAKKGETRFLAEDAVDIATLKKVIGETGYAVTDVEISEYKKKGIFGR